MRVHLTGGQLTPERSALYTSEGPRPGLNRLLHCMFTYCGEEPQDERMD